MGKINGIPPAGIGLARRAEVLCSCRCGLCGRALGMPTVARDLHRTCRVMAVVAAVFRAVLDEAVACRVRAFLLFLLSHGLSSYSLFGRSYARWERVSNGDVVQVVEEDTRSGF